MSKDGIRRKTDNFLDNFPGSSTFQSSPDNIIPPSFAGSEGSFFDAETSQALNQPLDNRGLTTAGTPYLPLTIVMADKYGEPLETVLLINPESMNHGKTHSVNANYTRRGFSTQVWGPNQDILTATGKSPAFLVAGEGLTHSLRSNSFGYLNFMTLLAAYKNNGYRFADPLDVNTFATRVINLVSGVEIFYDNNLYLGHFNNFTLDEDANNPYRFSYNFEFVISDTSGDYSNVLGHFQPIRFRSNLGAKTLGQLQERPVKNDLEEGVA